MDDENELPAAFVVLKDSAISDQPQLLEGIGAFTAKHVSPYKRLRGGLHAVGEIPKNPMGKVLHKDLRVMAQELRQKTVQAKL